MKLIDSGGLFFTLGENESERRDYNVNNKICCGRVLFD